MQDNKAFKARPGDSVQSQFIPGDGREPLDSRVIGHTPGKNIILATPSQVHAPLVLQTEE